MLGGQNAMLGGQNVTLGSHNAMLGSQNVMLGSQIVMLGSHQKAPWGRHTDCMSANLGLPSYGKGGSNPMGPRAAPPSVNLP